MKKSIFFSLLATLILTIMPSVWAVESYGTVKDITSAAGDSLTTGKGTLETKGNTTTIRYASATFKMLKEDKGAVDGERPGPAAWIGFEVTEPTTDHNSQFKVTGPNNKTTQIKSSSYREYVGITPDNLKNALLKNTSLTYKYAFDWDENGSDDQYVIIEIDPEEITLISADNGEIVWSPTMAKEILKQQNPNTSDIRLFPLLGLIILGGCGFFYCTKKV